MRDVETAMPRHCGLDFVVHALTFASIRLRKENYATNVAYYTLAA